MEYKVVPFVADINRNSTSDEVAGQLEQVINTYAKQGWIYLRMEDVTTNVAPSNGCFGFGSQPGYTTTKQLIIFGKQ